MFGDALVISPLIHIQDSSLRNEASSVHANQIRSPVNILKEPHTMFVTLIVEDIEATSNRAIALGATAMSSGSKIRPDLSIAFIQDPEGNYIELAQYDDIFRYRPDLRV
jgi:hypothetical protein